MAGGRAELGRRSLNALTRVPEDNAYHCGFVRGKSVQLPERWKDNEQMRRLGKLREGEYGFYMNGTLSPRTRRELTARS